MTTVGDELVLVQVGVHDPAAVPLLTDLAREYSERYGLTPAEVQQELDRYPAAEFEPPDGLLLVLLQEGHPVAGGAFRRLDERTAELKRIWTHPDHRRRGLGVRVLVELEARIRGAGYDRIFLTTGPRQPEAKNLYLRSGYDALFDVGNPPTAGPLGFQKFVTRTV